MQVHQRTSRRYFLNQGVCAAAAATISPFATAALGRNTDVPRFEVSLHQKSVEKLFSSKEIDLLKYPKFAKDVLGLSNIEFNAAACSHLLDAPEKADEYRKVAADNGVRIRTLLGDKKPALDAKSSKEREAAISEHVKLAKVAEHLGCDYMRIRVVTKGKREQQLKRATESIKMLCEKLSSSPVKVLIENLQEFSSDPDWLIDLHHRIGHDHVGLLADFANFDGDIYEGMKKILPFTRSICTKSWEFDAEGNETKIDFQRMMKIIKKSKFHGCIAIEYLGDKPVEGIKKTAALIKRYS
jgi:sugar phosphate isomerase/epimerase